MTGDETVTEATGEVAKFSDDPDNKLVVVRQRPGFGETATYVGYTAILQPQAFKQVFKLGSSINQIKIRLGDPATVDGTIEDNIHRGEKIGGRKMRLDPSEIQDARERLRPKSTEPDAE
jgi:hypothetical protein